jgi:uncharacterized membrane protein YccC
MAEVAASPTWRTTANAALFHGVSAAIVAVFSYATAASVPFLREAYWAPIAAVVVLYPDREATTKASLQRFAGTLVGSLLGWGAALTWHHHLALFGVAVFLTVGICYALRCEAAARLGAVAVTVITIIPHAEPAHQVAMYRFIEVTYGLACALGYTLAVDLLRRRLRRPSTQ